MRDRSCGLCLGTHGGMLALEPGLLFDLKPSGWDQTLVRGSPSISVAASSHPPYAGRGFYVSAGTWAGAAGRATVDYVSSRLDESLAAELRVDDDSSIEERIIRCVFRVGTRFSSVGRIGLLILFELFFPHIG